MQKSFFSLNNCAAELLEESLKDLVQKMVMSGEIAKPQANNMHVFWCARMEEENV
jgi:polyhydroxyalkanoate synthesis regulator phasin